MKNYIKKIIIVGIFSFILLFASQKAFASTCSISSFTASDTSIDDSGYSILRWNTNNCSHVQISDIGTVNEDGSKKVYPNEDTTYLLVAYDDNGYTKTKSVTIYVDNNSDYSYCSIDSFTTSDNYIDRGDSSTLRWKTTSCDDVSISGVGDVSDDGSEKVSPYNTTNYIIRAYGDNGLKTKSLKVNVIYSSSSSYVQSKVVYNNDLVTTVATNVSQTGALVNGFITNSDYRNSYVHFDYGTDVDLGSMTTPVSTNGDNNFSSYLKNLTPGTIYYFQAVSENSNGVSRGAIEVFQTLSDKVVSSVNKNTVTTIKKTVDQGKTIVNSSSPIMLKVENLYQSVGEGDIIDYTVYYKNISSSKLTNPMVQVFIPKGITLTNISNGTYRESERTLSVPIDDLDPSKDGTIHFVARVDSIDSNLAQIVTTAILVYTNSNGAQENAMAYVLNNPKVDSSSLLGASVLVGNGVSFGLIGWLLLIIFILLLIIVVRSFYSHRATKV